MRAVDIHKPFADGSKHIQCCGRAVDELAIGSGICKRAFKNKLMIVAWLEAVLVQKVF